MSSFELKACDITTGAVTEILPEYQKLQTSFEMSDVGALTIDYPRQGRGFSTLNAGTRVEVAVFKDGVEMDDARYRIQVQTGDEIKDDTTVKFTAVSLLNRFKNAIVYPADGSTSLATDQTFINATPGGILRALFLQNANRGTGAVCDEITWASFSDTHDSAGNAWAFTFGNITYKVGVNYLDIIRNMVDNGMIEVKMVGRDLRVYNAGGLGSDRTVGASPVVLRKGLDFEEAPQTRTSEQIAGVALIQGDESVLRQEVDTSVTTAWGRDEVFISQGGIKDTTTLGVVAQAELERRSQIRAERTRKIAVHGAIFQPYTDYRVSDYVFNDSGSGAGLERLRVRQLVIEVEQSGVVSASIVLNDKFLEREIAIARKVSGILGGASAGGSVAIPIPSPPEVGADTTIPKAPASLAGVSDVYVDDNGKSVTAVALSWPAVTQNTDNSTIADLEGYEVQWKADQEFTATPPTAIHPGRDLESMTRKFDRRGKGYGWLGADGGASTRATSGKDFWLFADTHLGVADQEGKVSQWNMVNNTFVLTDAADDSVFDAKWGYPNRLTTNDAWLQTTQGTWVVDATCTIARSATQFRYGTHSLAVTSTGAGEPKARLGTGVTGYAVTAGKTYTFTFFARSAATARQVASGIRFFNSGGSQLSAASGSNTSTTNSGWTRVTHTAVAPANAVWANPILTVRAVAAASEVFYFDQFGFYETDARHQSWVDPQRGASSMKSIVHLEELGGAALTGINDQIFWVDQVTTVGNKILGFMHKYTPTGTFGNQVYIAQWDGTTHYFESLTAFTTGDTVVWGSVAYQDATHLYIMGPDSTAPPTARTSYIMRVPIGNVTGGTKEFWTGAAWSTTRSSASVVYTGYGMQINDVILLGGTYVGVGTSYGEGTMRRFTASAITGPWTDQGSFYTQPETGSGIIAYFPRIHEQLASNAGIPMSYSVNGSVNGVDALGNIRYYAPKFLIGPPATVAPSVPTTDWSEIRNIDSASTTDHIGDIPPGSNFVARVRAADHNGNRSSWTTSSPIRTSEDTNPPNKPSTPMISTAFQGVRIEWDGLDHQGGPMPPDWWFTEVHLSEVANFTPGPLTRIDYFNTRGGVSPVQGLVYGRAYYTRLVAVDKRMNRSVPSDAASATPEQLVDVNEIANKLIAGAKIADGAIAVKHLTVATFDPNILPNGGFEDEATNGSGVGQGTPSHWTNSGWVWGAGATIALETAAPLSGSKSLKLTMAAATDGIRMSSVKFPVTPGRLLALSARVKASRAIATNAFELFVATGVSESDAGSFPGANSTWGVAATAVGTTSVQTLETQTVVPANHKWAVVYMSALQANDGSGWTATIDDVQCLPVGGSAYIADASILSAKIANLAVNDAKIANVSVGKLTAGILSADMTVSARIKTADTGARVELNSGGLRAYDAGGVNTVGILSTGQAFFAGDLYTGVSGSRIIIDSGGAGGLPQSTIFFMPGTGSNYGWITAPNSSTNVTNLHMATGTFTSSGTTVRARLDMGSTLGVRLGLVRTSDSAYWGGRLIMQGDGIWFDVGPSGMQVDNAGGLGHMWMGYGTETPVPVGTEPHLWYTDSGGMRLYGCWNAANYGSDAGVSTGYFTAAAGTSWSLAYGQTMDSPMVTVCTPRFNTAIGWALTASTGTGFTLNSTNTGAGTIYYWAIRIP